MPLSVAPCFLAIELPRWDEWCVARGAQALAARTAPPVPAALPVRAVLPARTLTRLAQRCMRWTPRIHIEREHGPPALVLDLTGCLPAHGGAARVVARVRHAFTRRGLEFHLGLAPTAGGAIALSAAHGGMPFAGATRVRTPLAIASPADPWHALDPLPVCALRLAPDTVEGLLEVNVQTIGELRAIDRHAVADRYGPQPAERLDALAGVRPWSFLPVAPPQRICGEFVFASPCVQLEAVEHAMRHAVAQLCDQLTQRVRGVSTLEVRVERARMAPVRGTLHFGAPTRDPNHLWRLLGPRVERMQLGCLEHGMGIERIQLVALRLGSAQCDATQQAIGQLVDQLAARLGDGSVRAADAAGASA